MNKKETPQKFIMKVHLGSKASVQTMVDFEKVTDVNSVIGLLCGQLGIPHIRELEMGDN